MRVLDRGAPLIAPGYAPTSSAALLSLGILLGGLVAAVALLARVRNARLARASAWGLALAAIAAMDGLAAAQPAGLRMLALCAATLYAMKGIVLTEHRLRGGRALSRSRWLGFTLLWPGMRPAEFANAEIEAGERTARLARRGALQLGVGLLFVLGARALEGNAARSPLAVPLLACGLSLAVHFGLFNLLAAAWRTRGAMVGPLFRSPLAATSLATFWSRRWNLAFSEMIQLSVARPLRQRLGARGAAVVGFLVSGVLHVLAISLPVQAGYGGPMLYFALHGVLVQFEPWLARRQRWLREGRWLAHLWVLVWIALPLPILFHAPFVEGVLEPLLR
ncbi:MAG: membrane bound O-acyl transferase family-domain-containing protein [Planctomycetes bacterium]|nr:membrane bound O-acyl transferase family-domain-containing protein [Planctomycetota bacterium]